MLLLILWVCAGISVFAVSKGDIPLDERWQYAIICIFFWWLIGFYFATSGR